MTVAPVASLSPDALRYHARVRALNQPESWWGWHGYNHPQPLSIAQIIASGTMSPRIAAIFWLGIERGLSLVLAADPPGAGKTTVLTALLPFADPRSSVYFTQGWGETFRLPPRAPDDPPTYLLINEISDHLPVYSWGPYVQRAFELLGDGYSLASTMHADTAEGVIQQLAEECDVPECDVGRLALIAPMFVGAAGGGRIRRISEVSVLEPLAASYDRHVVATWDAETDTHSALSTPAAVNALARRLGFSDEALIDEVARRERFMASLLGEGAASGDELDARLERFRREASG